MSQFKNINMLVAELEAELTQTEDLHTRLGLLPLEPGIRRGMRILADRFLRTKEKDMLAYELRKEWIEQEKRTVMITKV